MVFAAPAAEAFFLADALRAADAVQLYLGGSIEVGVLYAFISYLGRLNEPLIELTTQQSMLQQAVVAGERVFELMDRLARRGSADDRPLKSGVIEMDHLSFAYRGDNLVLGTSRCPCLPQLCGAGRTYRQRQKHPRQSADGLYPLTHGEIRIDGRPLASLSHSALRQGIAMVQQDPVVLADTFYANVALGRDISEEQVWEALEAVQLAALARRAERWAVPGWASRAIISPSGRNSCWRWRACWWNPAGADFG